MSTCSSAAWSGRPPSSTSSISASAGPRPRSRSWCPGSTHWPATWPPPTREGTTMSDGSADRLYFRQLLSGRDFARGDMMARQMVNFVYLIGDRETGEAVVVDPAYAVQDLLDIVAA